MEALTLTNKEFIAEELLSGQEKSVRPFEKVEDAGILKEIPAARFGLQRSAQVAVFHPVPAVKPGDVRFAHKIGRLLILPGALGAGHPIWRVFVASLLRENTGTVSGIKRIADIRLHADAVPSVLILPVDDISGDTVSFGGCGTTNRQKSKSRYPCF